MNDMPNFPPTLPPETIEQYVNSCDAIEMLYGIRHLEGVRVRESREVEVACRIVWNHTAALFRNGYEGGAPAAEDWGRLRMVLAKDEVDHPSDYQAQPRTVKAPRRSSVRDDDNVWVLDFVDPQKDEDDGNLIRVARRTLRMRDRSPLSELDEIAAFFHAMKSRDPGIKAAFVEQTRWAIGSAV